MASGLCHVRAARDQSASCWASHTDPAPIYTLTLAGAPCRLGGGMRLCQDTDKKIK